MSAKPQAAALRALPGALAPDRQSYAFPTLAYAGARGAVHLWTIRVRLLDAEGAGVPIEDAMLAAPGPPLPGLRAEIEVEAQQKGGKVRKAVPTRVEAGKNLGRRNATNALTQALRDALGLYNRQKKRAELVPTAGPPPPGAPPAAPEDPAAPLAAPEGPAAYDARPPPMLVKALGSSREATLTPAVFKAGVTVQRKLNGVRYVVGAPAGPAPPGSLGALMRYSRSKSDYPGQAAIGAELLPMFRVAPSIAPGEYGTPPVAATERDRRVLEAYGALLGPSAPEGAGYPGPYLDGELYLAGRPLNWISGQARREADSDLLEFHVFDVFFPRAKAAGHDMESRHRQAYLAAFFAAPTPHAHVVRVEGVAARDLAEVEALARGYVTEGYEGAIARKDAAGYRYGYSNYHSANLVKVKPRPDAEFAVIGYTAGDRGKDVGALVWVCEVARGAPNAGADRTFTVVPNMSYAERYALYRCLGEDVGAPGAPVTRFERDFKGRPLVVEFAELSPKTGKPLQPKALAFRTYEGGPDRDPVRRALIECGVVAK